MSAEQLIFDLGKNSAYKREDFLAAPGNAAALGFIQKWPEWPVNTAVIFGPKASGKTHILHVWQNHSAACIITAADMTQDGLMRLQASFPKTLGIDDIDRLVAGDSDRQDFMFHLLNEVKAHDAALLMTATHAPQDWDVSLMDLDSRIKALQLLPIEAPDDTLLFGLFVKLLHDRQLHVDPDVVPFTVSRLERSCAAVINAVEKIDAASLKEKRRITLPFVKKTLDI